MYLAGDAVADARLDYAPSSRRPQPTGDTYIFENTHTHTVQEKSHQQMYIDIPPHTSLHTPAKKKKQREAKR